MPVHKFKLFKTLHHYYFCLLDKILRIKTIKTAQFILLVFILTILEIT